jgi:hypothetical protein
VALPAALRTLGVAAVALVFLQIVFGALLTHRGLLDLHLVGAAAVFVLVPILTARARATGAPLLVRPAVLLLGLLFLQLGLGVGAYVVRFSGLVLPGGSLTTLALPVLHRLVAAMILGAAVAVLAGLLRLSAVATGVPSPGRVPVVSLPLSTGS